MPLDLPDHDRCFVDANIFYYHFVEPPLLSEPCTTLLERAAIENIEIFTSLHAISETATKSWWPRRSGSSDGVGQGW